MDLCLIFSSCSGHGLVYEVVVLPALGLLDIAGSVFITTCDMLGAIVVALADLVVALPAVVTVLVLQVLGGFVIVAWAIMDFCLVVVGVLTAVVSCCTLFFNLLYLAYIVLLPTSELLAFFII